MNDHKLDQLIRQASPPPDFPSSFQREVWQRIAVAENRSQGFLARFISDALQWMVKPAGAVATIMTMLIVGAGLGGIVSARPSESSLKAAYTASINPIVSAHASEK